MFLFSSGPVVFAPLMKLLGLAYRPKLLMTRLKSFLSVGRREDRRSQNIGQSGALASACKRVVCFYFIDNTASSLSNKLCHIFQLWSAIPNAGGSSASCFSLSPFPTPPILTWTADAETRPCGPLWFLYVAIEVMSANPALFLIG